MLPLSIELPTVPAKDIYITDWGIFDSVCLLTQGTLPLRESLDALSKPVVDAVDRKTLIGRMSNPDAVFAGFTDGNEQFAGVNQRLRDVAQTAGFRKESLRVIRDRNGRYRIEVFRFLK